MNQFKSSYSRLRNVLASSVAVIGLASVAQAQVAELKGLRDNKDFGGSSSFYLPLGNNINTGMPFFSIGAGLLGGSQSGEALVGFGKGLGDTIGIRGYVGVGLKDSRHNLFTTARAGVEVSFGGVGLNVSGSVPFGKTRQVSSKGHSDVVLVDPSGQQCDPTGTCVPVPPSCSNPAPGQVRHCEIGVAVTDPSYEKALKGFEVGLDYQVQMGGVWLRPSLGYYRYGNGLVSGAKAGFEVSVPLTSQLSLNIGAGGRNEFRGNNKGMSGFGSLGISYHFGGVAVSQLSALEHRFAEAPNRNQRTLTTHTKEGNTVVYRPGAATEQQGLVPSPFTPVWDQTNHAVSEVWLVDHSNEAMADEIVAGAKEGAIVVFDGSKGDIILDDQIVLSAGYQGMVGGGNTLKFYTAFGDIYTTLPGSRGKIVQNDKTRYVFYVNGVENPIIYGVDMEKGKTGIEFINVTDGRIHDVTISNTNQTGISIRNSKRINIIDAHLINPSLALGFNGLSVQLSQDIQVDHFSSINSVGVSSGGSVFDFTNVDRFSISNVFISMAKNLYDAGTSSIMSSNDGKIRDFTVVANTAGGLSISDSRNIDLSGLDIGGFSTAINLTHVDNVTIHDSTLRLDRDIALTRGVLPSAIYIHNTTSGDTNAVSLQNVNILLDYRVKSGSTGVHIPSATGTVSLTLKDVQVQILSDILFDVTAFRFQKGAKSNIILTDGGGNRSAGIAHVCDGVADATGSILVNGTERCQ